MVSTAVTLGSAFLALERDSDTKHELIFGELIAMDGASKEHNKVLRNWFYHFQTYLKMIKI